MENESEQPKKEGKRRPVWDFINSSLGIWFLSTIVIGAFSFAFNEYKEGRQENIDRQSKIKQLDLEIESRISQFWVHMNKIVNEQDTTYPLKQGISADTIHVLWSAFKNPPSRNPALMTTIYREYETRTTISLIIELSTLLEDKYNLKGLDSHTNRRHAPPTDSKTSRAKSAEVAQVEKIRKAATFIGGDGIYYNSGNPGVKEIWKAFNENIILDRWNKLFPYTDCFLCQKSAEDYFYRLPFDGVVYGTVKASECG